MSDLKRSIERETEAARCLLANVRDILADDEQATLDAVEGETHWLEAIESAVNRVSEVKAHQEAIGVQMKALAARKARFEAQGERIRAAILVAMADLDLKKLELPQATITRKPVPPKAQIINEAEIPARFWKPSDPTLDKKAVLDALKDKEDVPGAVLSNTSETLAIREG